MKEFSAYINYCEQQFKNTVVCQNCPYGQCIHPCPSMDGQNCYACLNKIHYYRNEDLKYQCDRITYNYVLKHGHRYASEMDQVLGLLKHSVQFPNEINIYSVGCGPCTELFGVVNQFGSQLIHFKGFDLNPLWKQINDFEKGLFPNRDIQFYLEDFFKYMANCDDHADILILNYMLSDLARYKSPDICSTFIDNVVALCEQKRISSIAINDVYLCYAEKTGYVLMEELARKLQLNKNINEKIGRGHFATPKPGQPIYGKYKGSEDLTFPIVEKSVQTFSPFPTCGSILMLALFQ
ncbi:MAG: hypothetical protein K5864_02185 [Bacteroidales bacterium]|nr:hypothetical protein [Bacteroidales bacterium]